MVKRMFNGGYELEELIIIMKQYIMKYLKKQDIFCIPSNENQKKLL